MHGFCMQHQVILLCIMSGCGSSSNLLSPRCTFTTALPGRPSAMTPLGPAWWGPPPGVASAIEGLAYMDLDFRQLYTRGPNTTGG
jgi:hypothetical protein